MSTESTFMRSEEGFIQGPQLVILAVCMVVIVIGGAILLVDKSLSELSQIADRAVILQRGADVWSGKFEDLSEEISSRYIGV